MGTLLFIIFSAIISIILNIVMDGGGEYFFLIILFSIAFMNISKQII